MGLYSVGLIVGRIFASEIWGAYCRESLFLGGLIIGILRYMFNVRDFKQREPQPQRERQSLRENPNNQLRMTGDKNSDVLRSAPT